MLRDLYSYMKISKRWPGLFFTTHLECIAASMAGYFWHQRSLRNGTHRIYKVLADWCEKVLKFLETEVISWVTKLLCLYNIPTYCVLKDPADLYSRCQLLRLDPGLHLQVGALQQTKHQTLFCVLSVPWDLHALQACWDSRQKFQITRSCTNDIKSH